MGTMRWKMGWAFGFLLFLFIMVLPAASANANTYYISPTGSDTTGDGTLLNPWKTWARAETVLTPGDTLYARGGTYYEQTGVWNVSGTAAAPITFAAYPGEVPVFDGDDHVNAPPIVNFINVQTAKWLVFDGLTIQNYKANGIWLGYTGTAGQYTENVVIQNSTFQHIGRTTQDHAIYVSWGNNNITIRGNKMDTAAGAAIHMYHFPGGTNYQIYNNVMSNSYWGVLVDDVHDNAAIFNNTFYHNTRSIQISKYEGHNTSNTTIYNNVSYTTGGTGLMVDPANTGQVTEDNNIWYDSINNAPIQWGSTRYSVAGLRAATNNAGHSIQADPLFVSNGSDFHLQSNSPAINAGITIPALMDDFDGVSRPQGLAYDIGAFEHVDTMPPTTTDNAPAGWMNTDVTVTLTASDSESVVAATYYTVGGSEPQTGTTITLTEDGIHTISYWSVDGSGNTEAPKTAVVKIDKTPPTLHVTLDKPVLWAPDHKLADIHATVTAEDSGSQISTIVLTSITSNEPDNSSIQEAEFGTFDTAFKLRAERAGSGSGRIYTVTYTATDQAGNSTTASATVVVPHDQSE